MDEVQLLVVARREWVARVDESKASAVRGRVAAVWTKRTSKASACNKARAGR